MVEHTAQNEGSLCGKVSSTQEETLKCCLIRRRTAEKDAFGYRIVWANQPATTCKSVVCGGSHLCHISSLTRLPIQPAGKAATVG